MEGGHPWKQLPPRLCSWEFIGRAHGISPANPTPHPVVPVHVPSPPPPQLELGITSRLVPRAIVASCRSDFAGTRVPSGILPVPPLPPVFRGTIGRAVHPTSPFRPVLIRPESGTPVSAGCGARSLFRGRPANKRAKVIAGGGEMRQADSPSSS